MSSIEGIEDPFGPGTAGGTRILYISPLKALGADVERNLRAPLTGITRLSGNNTGEPNISVGVRSGDTPARKRRQLISNPPDILITTPECWVPNLADGNTYAHEGLPYFVGSHGFPMLSGAGRLVIKDIIMSAGGLLVAAEAARRFMATLRK